jgi:hypothetical protein
MKNSSQVEIKLIQQEIDVIESYVMKGCNDLTWNSVCKYFQLNSLKFQLFYQSLLRYYGLYA